jgi:hypothetical protein
MTAKGSQDNVYNHVLLVSEILQRLVVRREKAFIQRFIEELASISKGGYQVRAEFHRKWFWHICYTVDAKELLRFDREVKHVQTWIFGQHWPNLL